jgi:ribosomal-protein-alanine N-acetyltransferase
MISLQTSRLILRPVARDDLELFVAFYGDPSIMAIRKLGVLDAQGAARELDTLLEHWRRHGFGMWVVEERDSRRFAGECGLRWLEDDSDVELSYGLCPELRGQGLATEAARCVLEHGFTKLGLRRIVALSRGDNRVSHRVLEKIGMTLEWRRPVGHRGLVKYAVEVDAWRRAGASGRSPV